MRQCPHCGSSDTAMKKALYMMGSAQFSTGIYSGQSQSLMARRIAPPQMKSVIWNFGLFEFVALFVLTMANLLVYIVGKIVKMENDNLIWLIPILYIILNGSFIYYQYRNYNWNKTIYWDLYEQWEKEWCCKTCGEEWSYK